MNNYFNGTPSRVLEQRPFFSIIIPCYNSRKTLGKLLDSILAQDMNDEIEIILADDQSPESYQDIVNPYRDILSIRQIKTDYNFAPGNTREKGVGIAEGYWVCFADHDDEFIPGTLKQIQEAIIQNQETQYVISNFYEMDPDTREIKREMIRTGNWMHAKFYNLDNFWKRFDIHFQKDLLTHEDICVSSQIACATEISGRPPLFLDLFTYCWMDRPTTVSREKYGDHAFLEVFFKDYIESTGYTYYRQFFKYGMKPEYTYNAMIEVFVYCYFYMQGIKFHQPHNWIRDNEQYIRDYFIKIKETFKVTNKDIYNYIAQNDAAMFMSVKDSACIGVGPFIECETLEQFMNKLHKDIPIRETMSQALKKENL